MARLRLPIVSARLHVDDDAALIALLLSELPADIDTDELLSLSMALLVVYIPISLTMHWLGHGNNISSIIQCF